MNRSAMTLAALALAVGLGIGYSLSESDGGKMVGSNKADTASMGTGPCPGGGKPLMWRNPMNPSITSPTFQKDSMGMDYQPVCAEEGAAADRPAGSVAIDPVTVQNIGVRTTEAVRRDVANQITTVGRVTFDETRLVTLHPKVEGWVDKLFVDKTGEVVRDDSMLLSFYSPQLVATQDEYLLALDNWQRLKDSPYPDISNGAKRLLDASLDRLEFFDVAHHQIEELKRTHKVRKSLHIHAPAAGVVTKIGVREGAHVTPASELYEIADLSHVWVLADLYEYEIPWVKEGDVAQLSIASLPGHVFTGKITYIYPYLDARTRTNKVRIEFDNAEGLLKPDMFGDVNIAASSRKPGIYVPGEAVLITGKQAHVFVETSPGRFEPRRVETGNRVDGMIEILGGVKAGEQVVTSGQFLIDSESSIREAAAKMLEPKSEGSPAAPAPAQAGTGMDMKDGMDMGGMTVETPPEGHAGHSGMKEMDTHGMDMKMRDAKSPGMQHEAMPMESMP